MQEGGNQVNSQALILISDGESLKANNVNNDGYILINKQLPPISNGFRVPGSRQANESR